MQRFDETIEDKLLNSTNYFHNHLEDDLENDIDTKVKAYIDNLRFSIIYKPAIISIVALVISFFMDISKVPILGNISIDIAKSFFPGWQPAVQSFQPYEFWWLPVLTYAFFVLVAYLVYIKLKDEILRNPTSETVDRLIDTYSNVIDSVATALPLLGAALLLISVRLGEEIFLGLSVPFEIKALIVLAIGKLFEPVLDQIGLEFQNIVSHIRDLKELYFSHLQIENTNQILEKLKNSNNPVVQIPKVQAADIENYKRLMLEISNISLAIKDNYTMVYNLLERINLIPQLSTEKIDELKSLADSIHQASAFLNNENAITGLKYLESIVKK
jgi:hypothetical protein